MYKKTHILINVVLLIVVFSAFYFRSIKIKNIINPGNNGEKNEHTKNF